MCIFKLLKSFLTYCPEETMSYFSVLTESGSESFCAVKLLHQQCLINTLVIMWLE